jgi:hypothetical protein
MQTLLIRGCHFSTLQFFMLMAKCCVVVACNAASALWLLNYDNFYSTTPNYLNASAVNNKGPQGPLLLYKL